MALPFYEQLRRSLSAKITIAILLATAVGALVHGVLGHLSMKKQTMETLQAHGTLLAKYLSTYVEHQMGKHKGDDLSLLVEGIKNWTEVQTVHLLDSEGVIKISGDPSEIGKRVDLSTSNSDPWFVSKEVPHITSLSFRDGILTIRRELPNKPLCMGCHDGNRTINGYLEIGISPGDMDGLLHSQWPRQALTGLIILTMLCVVSIWLLRHLVLNRIRRIGNVIKQIEAGDLTARTADTSPDELGQFSQHFDLMIAELEGSRRKVEKAHNLEIMHFDRLAAIGEFSSGLAHEIRNPLAGFSAALQRLLKSRDLSSQHRQILTEAHHQLTRLDETTRRLLAFACPEAPVLRNIDANEMIQQFVPVLKTLAKGVAPSERDSPTLRLDLADCPLPIQGDPKLLQQVLINLVLNGFQAQTHKPAKDRAVVISTEFVPPNAPSNCEVSVDTPPSQDSTLVKSLSRCSYGSVRILVRDYGPGFAPEIEQKMFNPFFTTKEGGTGLGLSVCSRIVREHGGCLFGRNAEKGGAVFIICFPVQEKRGVNNES